MAKIIKLKTFRDKRGSLSVIDKNIPFEIKRVFYIYKVDDSKRGFHKHKKTIQLAICISGSCSIVIQSNTKEEIQYKLKDPNEGLIIEACDYHWMENFSKGAVLLVMASEFFDENDYILKNL